ncbi:MAG: alpha/beta hydrolase family protein [Rubrivivax sp.]
MTLSRRTFITSAVAACVPVGGWGLGLRSAQAQTGRSALGAPSGLDGTVRTLDLDWADTARQRPVPVRLYLPAQASRENPVPLVVFSHGIGGSRRGYSYLGSHFASEGFASLHLQHVGSDRSLWGGGSPLALVGRLQGAAQEAEAIARVHDLRFALDQALGGEFAALLDGQRVVAAGHSYGANTTLLASGAQVVREGRALDLREPRIRAAIVISAPPFYGESALASILGPVRVPSLHISATEDVILLPGYYSGPNDRVAVFDAIGSPRKTLALFNGGSHSMFTDRTGTGGALLNGQVKVATKELGTAFLRQVLQGDDTALRAWPQRHADIVARFVTAG